MERFPRHATMGTVMRSYFYGCLTTEGNLDLKWHSKSGPRSQPAIKIASLIPSARNAMLLHLAMAPSWHKDASSRFFAILFWPPNWICPCHLPSLSIILLFSLPLAYLIVKCFSPTNSNKSQSFGKRELLTTSITIIPSMPICAQWIFHLSNLFNKYLSSGYCMPITLLATNTTYRYSCPHKACE